MIYDAHLRPIQRLQYTYIQRWASNVLLKFCKSQIRKFLGAIENLQILLDAPVRKSQICKNFMISPQIRKLLHIYVSKQT